MSVSIVINQIFTPVIFLLQPRFSRGNVVADLESHMPFQYNADQVGYAIEAGQEAAESAAAQLVDQLIDLGGIRIHAGCTSVYEERKRIIKNAASVMLFSILTTDASMIDDATLALWGAVKPQAVAAA